MIDWNGTLAPTRLNRRLLALASGATVTAILAACGGSNPTATTAPVATATESAAAATTAASASSAVAAAGAVGRLCYRTDEDRIFRRRLQCARCLSECGGHDVR